MPIEIIRLGAGDIALARGLNALFAEAFEDPDSYASRPPDDEYLERTLRRPEVIALVAFGEGRVIGAAVAYELPKLEQARSEVYLYDLAVVEPWRRLGVATALIAELRTIARERGAWVVYVQGDYGDEPALALYDKLGTREEVLHFDIAP